MPIQYRHTWVNAAGRNERESLLEELFSCHVLARVSGHRNLRGPYGAIGSILRKIVPVALQQIPHVVRRYDIEILAAAPELDGTVECWRKTLAMTVPARERVRFHSSAHTRRIANGMAEFLSEYVDGVCQERTLLIIEDVDFLDPADVELLEVLLRRLDPAKIQLALCSGSSNVAQPLINALQKFAIQRKSATTKIPPTPESLTDDEAAQLYLHSDCTSDNVALAAAYHRISESARIRLHDARASQLVSLGEFSWRLGAVPFHLERGSDSGLAVAALSEALDHCLQAGFYDATIDFADRISRIIDWDTAPEASWLVTASAASAMVAPKTTRSIFAQWIAARHIGHGSVVE